VTEIEGKAIDTAFQHLARRVREQALNQVV
jgi:hypothetical protein